MLSLIYNCLYKAWSNFNTQKKLNALYKRYSSRVQLKKLTPQQIDQIQRYYQSVIGRKVDTRWHSLLYSITGEFTPRYMPFDVYHRMLEKLSPWKYIKILDDKNLYRQFFHNFKIPDRILECSMGKCLIIDNQKVAGGGMNDAVKHCYNAGICIIKPSIASSAGNGVKKVNFTNGIDTISGKSIEDVLKFCGKNFVVEKTVIENDNLRNLNPTSCNTIRIHTYRNMETGEIKFVSAFLRIGRKGQFVDNGGMGGICVSLDDDGRCVGDTAWTSKTFSSVTHTDNGIEIDRYQIDNYNEIINTAISAHKELYHFDLIGWDMAVNDKNEVVIIEFNPNPDLRLDQVWFKDTCLKDCQDEILQRIPR